MPTSLLQRTVAIVQAATQIQEQTLTLLPKILAVAAALAFFGPFGFSLCAELLRSAVRLAPALARG